MDDPSQIAELFSQESVMPVIESVRNLPNTIKRNYQKNGPDAESISGIWNGQPNNVQTYEIEFLDGTTDVWEWVYDESKAGTAFTHSWVLTDTFIDPDAAAQWEALNEAFDFSEEPEAQLGESVLYRKDMEDVIEELADLRH